MQPPGRKADKFPKEIVEKGIPCGESLQNDINVGGSINFHALAQKQIPDLLFTGINPRGPLNKDAVLRKKGSHIFDELSLMGLKRAARKNGDIHKEIVFAPGKEKIFNRLALIAACLYIEYQRAICQIRLQRFFQTGIFQIAFGVCLRSDNIHMPHIAHFCCPPQ